VCPFYYGRQYVGRLWYSSYQDASPVVCLSVPMYVRTYLCMYVCTYVCMCVCLYSCSNSRNPEQIFKRPDTRKFYGKLPISTFTGPNNENRGNKSIIGVTSQSKTRSKKLYNCYSYPYFPKILKWYIRTLLKNPKSYKIITWIQKQRCMENVKVVNTDLSLSGAVSMNLHSSSDTCKPHRYTHRPEELWT
jgi:hypothetical protein